MTIDTKHVKGRRELHFNSMDDILAEARQLMAGDVRMLGNWSLGQVMKHLALVIECSIDGFPFMMPLPFRFLMGLLMKKRFLSRPMPTGFKAPKKAAPLIPDEIDNDQAFAALSNAIERYKNETKRSTHPGLGPLTLAEWDQLHARHSETHLSFALPVTG